MRKLWKYVVDAEPVALFSGLATLIPLVTNGFVVFDAWNPTAEQLAYTNGAVLVLSTALGVQGTRRLVTPTSQF